MSWIEATVFIIASLVIPVIAYIRADLESFGYYSSVKRRSVFNKMFLFLYLKGMATLFLATVIYFVL